MNQLVKLKDYPFHHKTKTRWKDLDAFQHINNAVFLSYFEDARVGLFERWTLQPNGKSIIVASAKVNYYKQLIHPTDFNIGQKVSRLGNTSFDIQSTLFDGKGTTEPNSLVAEFSTLTVDTTAPEIILELK